MNQELLGAHGRCPCEPHDDYCRLEQTRGCCWLRRVMKKLAHAVVPPPRLCGLAVEERWSRERAGPLNANSMR